MPMLPFKKLLCPTDFSEPSYKALKSANELTLHFSSELILLHVVSPIHVIPIPDPPVGIYAPSYAEDMGVLARKKLQEVVQGKLPREAKARAIVAHGNPADEIIRTATDEHADIIVIATHGLTGWRHLLFGSVAEKVVRLAPCMVLTIRAPGEAT